MKRSGFSLIELLAVIVILAIITLIATPIVINIIENSKKGAAERTAENYMSAVETAATIERLDGNILNGEYTIDENGNLTGNGLIKPLKIQINGNKPSMGGTIIIENGQVVDKLTDDPTKKTTMLVGQYTVSYDTEGKIIVTKELEKVVYRWGTNSIGIGTKIDPTDTTKYTTNPATLEKNIYLKHVLDKDNKVTKSYTCNRYNNKEVCVRGGVDANGSSYFNENKLILQDIQKDGFTCSTSETNPICRKGSLAFDVSSGGYAGTRDDISKCIIYQNNTSICKTI